MNSEEFVKSIIDVVRDASISDSIEDLVDPPGKKPSSEDLELSNWFLHLSDKEKEIVVKIIRRAVDTSIFGFFTVLDGVRPIVDSDKGILELYYRENDNNHFLNTNQEEYLHDIFNRKI